MRRPTASASRPRRSRRRQTPRWRCSHSGGPIVMLRQYRAPLLLGWF
jgi:hypothetical protein